MKLWSTIVLSFIILSCSKNSDLDDSISALGVSDEIYVSNWEQIPSWQEMDSASFTIYYANKRIPAITQDAINKATVITYSKVNTTNPDFIQFTNPTRLDYYFVPKNAKPIPGHFHWYDVHSKGNIRLSFSMLDGTPFPDNLRPEKFWFRHIVIPPHLLPGMGLTPDKIKYEYSYEQLMDLLDIEP